MASLERRLEAEICGKGRGPPEKGGHMGISQGEGYSGSPGSIKSQQLFMFGYVRMILRTSSLVFLGICVTLW